MRSFISRMGQVHGMVWLILAMALAGSSVVVGKSLTGSLPVFMISFSTMVVSFLVLLPAAACRWKEIAGLSFAQWISLFMQALCGIVLFRVFTLYGLQHTGAVQAGVILGTTPAVLTVLAMVLLGERSTIGGMAGVGCAVCGVVVLNLSTAHDGGQGSLMGCLLVLAAVLAEALFTIFRKKVASEISAVTNTVGLTFISVVLLLPFALWEFYTQRMMPDSGDAFAIGYYAVFGTVIAYLLWTQGVGKVSGEAAGVATAAMPASSVLLAALVLGEPVTLQHTLGCILVMAGIGFSSLLNPSKSSDLEHGA